MYKSIKEIVEGLKEIYNTTDPFTLCSELDIKIIETNLGENLLGFFQRIYGEEIIYLNNKIENEDEKKYVCFHELGHVICHPELSISFLDKTLYITNKYENEADMFAAYFLIPEDPEPFEVERMTITQLSNRYSVPEKLIKLRFRNTAIQNSFYFTP